jgi:hypothetical protein
MSAPQVFDCTKDFTLTITSGYLPCVAWTTTAILPTVFVGFDYSEQVIYDAGVPNLVYSVTIGPLPAGLSLSSAGLITGIPTADGTTSFWIQATDGACVLCYKQFTIVVMPGDVDCGWVEEFDTPGVSLTTRGCNASYGGIKLLTAVPQTGGVCLGDLPTVSGFASYWLDIAATGVDRELAITCTGILNVFPSTQCGNHMGVVGSVQVLHTNLTGVPPVFLLDLQYYGDTMYEYTGQSGAVLHYTGILPAGSVCRITVLAGVSLSGLNPDPSLDYAKLMFFYHIKDVP